MTTISKFPPYDANGFYLPNGKPAHGCYGPPRAPDEDEIKTAIAYLSQLKPTKKPTFSSYYLKHRAEQWGNSHGMEAYVSNGALIAAAIHLGLSIKPRNINADIGVSIKDVRYVK